MATLHHAANLRSPHRANDWLLNGMTVVVLAALACSVAAFTLANPSGGAAASLFPVTPLPSTAPSIAPSIMPSAARPAASEVPPEPALPAILVPQADEAGPTAPVPTAAAPAPVIAPEPAPAGQATFRVRATAQTADAALFHPGASCDWSGLGGEVVDLQGRAVPGLVIRVGGIWSGQAVDLTSLSGTVPAYGQAGYEVELAEGAGTAGDALWAQLTDAAGVALSEPVEIEPGGRCGSNLVLVIFEQFR